MAVTVHLYDRFAASLLGGLTGAETRKVDWLTDDIRVRLHTSAYVPNRNTHQFASDLTNELATAGGYTAGGLLLAGKTITQDNPNFRVIFDASDAIWVAGTFTARIATMLCAREAADANRELMGYIDFGIDKTVAGQDFKIIWDALGIFRAAMT